MKFIKRISQKTWNDNSGQSQIRLLNYLLGFIIVLSFWSIGQVVNSPSGEAWGNILRIGQLPIWLTSSGNNNNNNNCPIPYPAPTPCPDCNQVAAYIQILAQNIKTTANSYFSAVEQ